MIMGPSAGGKSTFIPTFNAVEKFQTGSMIIDGINFGLDLKNIEIVRREVGMVFQQLNLFPHLTVVQNITLALGGQMASSSRGGSGNATLRKSGYLGAGKNFLVNFRGATATSSDRSWFRDGTKNHVI